MSIPTIDDGILRSVGTQTEFSDSKICAFLSASLDLTVYHINCFYCKDTFSIWNWSNYIQHMQDKHCDDLNPDFDQLLINEHSVLIDLPAINLTATENAVEEFQAIAQNGLEKTSEPVVFNAAEVENAAEEENAAEIENDENEIAAEFVLNNFVTPQLCTEQVDIKSEPEVFEKELNTILIEHNTTQEQGRKRKYIKRKIKSKEKLQNVIMPEVKPEQRVKRKYIKRKLLNVNGFQSIVEPEVIAKRKCTKQKTQKKEQLQNVIIVPEVKPEQHVKRKYIKRKLLNVNELQSIVEPEVIAKKKCTKQKTQMIDSDTKLQKKVKSEVVKKHLLQIKPMPRGPTPLSKQIAKTFLQGQLAADKDTSLSETTQSSVNNFSKNDLSPNKEDKCQPLKIVIDISEEETEQKEFCRPKKGISKQLVAKEKVERGIEHVTLSGKVKTCKVFKPQTNCKCSKEMCSSKINVERQKEIFDEFYRNSKWTQKALFLRKSVKANPVALRKYAKFIFIYTLVDNHGVSKTVCRDFFLKCLQVTPSRVYASINCADMKRKDQENRGKPLVKNKTTDQQKKSIKDFINQLPKYELNCCQRQAGRKFLIHTLNVSTLYREFKLLLQLRQVNENEIPNQNVFRRIFKKEYDLLFKSQHSDTCRICYKTKANKRTSAPRRFGLQNAVDEEILLIE